MNIHNQIRDLIHRHTSRSRGTMSYEDSLILITGLILIRRIECTIAPYRKQMRNQYVHSVNIFDDEALEKTLLQGGEVEFYNTTDFTLESIFLANGSIVYNLVSYVQGFNPQVCRILDQLKFERIIAEANYGNTLLSALNDVIGLDLDPKVVSNAMLASAITLAFHQNYVRNDSMSTSSSLYAKLVSFLLPSRSIKSEHIVIYDPACGLNSLTRSLANALDCSHRLREEHLVEVFGQDQNPVSCAISQFSNLMTGENPDNIKCGDTLSNDLFEGRKFQYIVADLPIGLKLYDAFSLLSDSRYKAGITKSDASLMFIQHIVSKMDPNGCRAAIFTGIAPLMNGGANTAENNVRRWLIEQDLIETIIALPKKANPRLDVPTYLWILDNQKSSKQKGKIRIIDGEQVAVSDSIPSLYSLFAIKVNRLYTKKDVPGVSALVESKSFGNYQISLINKASKEKRTVEVPIQEDVIVSLKKKGYTVAEPESQYMVRDDSGFDFDQQLWEIDYYETTSTYKFDLSKFLNSCNTVENYAKSSFSELKPCLSESLTLLRQLDAINIPQETKGDIVSSDDWYKSSPAHWKRIPLHYGVYIRSGRSLSEPLEGDESFDSAEKLPVLSVPYLRGQDETVKEVSFETAQKSGLVIEEGDILLITAGANAGEILSGKKGMLGGSLSLIQPTSVFTKQFLIYLLKAAEVNLRSMQIKVTIPRLRRRDIEEMIVCVPTLAEQEIIANYLDRYCAIIDNLNKLGFNNPQLKEFQKSLIYEAVTGKLDLDDMK